MAPNKSLSPLGWLRLKLYQFDITFTTYMLTPAEKTCVFTLLALMISMVVYASTMYLPSHVSTIARRALFYFTGEHSSVSLEDPMSTGLGQEQILGHTDL